MRTIEETKSFRKDIKRELKGVHRSDVHTRLDMVLRLLTAGERLPRSMRDHELKGKFAGIRECHVRPDLLLMYELVDEDIVRLIRLGSHAELFE